MLIKSFITIIFLILNKQLYAKRAVIKTALSLVIVISVFLQNYHLFLRVLFLIRNIIIMQIKLATNPETKYPVTFAASPVFTNLAFEEFVVFDGVAALDLFSEEALPSSVVFLLPLSPVLSVLFGFGLGVIFLSSSFTGSGTWVLVKL